MVVLTYNSSSVQILSEIIGASGSMCKRMRMARLTIWSISSNILSGLQYDGQMVWLSAENQANYKAAYDLAVQTQGESLPYKVKLGSEDAPVYKVFNSLQDFKAFFLAIQKHIQDTISEGWKKKDSIDWSQYQA